MGWFVIMSERSENPLDEQELLIRASNKMLNIKVPRYYKVEWTGVKLGDIDFYGEMII